jgi:hypothetical protein
MGSDLYRVGLNEYHELSKAKAIQRALAYGHPAKETNDFFVSDGIWLELNLSIASIHPDACVDWTPSFITRIIDEGVTSWNQPNKIEHDKTPLHKLYPELWEMRFSLNKKNPPVVLVVQAEYYPEENPKPKSFRKDDAVDVVAFINKQYAPNLKGVTGWESRAWPGKDEPAPEEVTKQRIRRAEIRLMPFLFWISDKAVQVKEKGQWKKLAKSPWEAHTTVHFDTDGSPLLLGPESVTRIEKDWSSKELLHYPKKGKIGLGEHIVRDKQGDLWINSHTGLIRQDAKGKITKLTTKDGLAGNNIDGLCLDAQGRLVVATAGGLSMRRGDKWENLKEGLADKGCRQVLLADDGALWVSGFKGVTRIAPDKSITLFKSRQGLDGTITDLSLLPGGGAWVTTYRGTFEIAPGAIRAVPCDILNRLAPKGVNSSVKSGDTLWIATKDYIVCLRSGQRPHIYQWEQPYPDPKLRYPEFWNVFPAPDGGIWIRHAGDLFVFTKAELEKIDATTPINAEVCPPSSIPVFAMSDTKVPATSKAAATAKTATAQSPTKKSSIDLKGKIVVLTGTLSMTREEAETKLKAKGAIIGGSLSAKTNYLLAGLKAGSKLEKAKTLGVAVIDEDALL